MVQRRATPLTQDALEVLVVRYDSGEQLVDLANEVGYNKISLYHALRKAGAAGRQKPRITADDPRAREALALFDEGEMGYYAVAAKFGMANETLRRLLTETGRPVDPARNPERPRGRQRALAVSQERELAKRYGDGETTSALATAFDVSPETVRGILKRLSQPRRVPGRTSSLTDDKVRELNQRYLAGETAAALGAECGHRGQSVTRRFHQLGLPLLPKRKVDDDELNALHERYLQGESAAQLAREAGYKSAGSLVSAFDRQDLRRHQAGPRGVTSVDPRAQRGLKLWDEGMGFKKAAAAAGIDARTLRRILAETGRDPSLRKGGPGHPLWKGGRQVTEQGYVRLWVDPEDPLAEMRSDRGYVLEHRLVMARHLGRPLLRTETVHHKNESDRDDNRIENLQLRIGQHGNGGAWQCSACGSPDLQLSCRSCGSYDVEAVPLN